MSNLIEGTIEALVEFESALDRIRSETSDSKKRMLKNAEELVATSKANALSKAHDFAARRLEVARTEAKAEADAIRARGDSDMRRFQATISKRKREAAELVTHRLLGESP